MVSVEQRVGLIEGELVNLRNDVGTLPGKIDESINGEVDAAA